MLGYIFFTFWRLFEIVTLIPTLGILVSVDILRIPHPRPELIQIGILCQYQPESKSTHPSLNLVGAS